MYCLEQYLLKVGLIEKNTWTARTAAVYGSCMYFRLLFALRVLTKHNCIAMSEKCV